MPYYSYKDLVNSFGASKDTLVRRLKAAKFKKKSPGVLFTEEEAKQIAAKLEFTLLPKAQNGTPSR